LGKGLCALPDAFACEDSDMPLPGILQPNAPWFEGLTMTAFLLYSPSAFCGILPLAVVAVHPDNLKLLNAIKLQ